MLTKKGTTQSKGCAFLEYSDAESHGNALGMHLTKLHGRLINVELTVGGGGRFALDLPLFVN